MHNIIMGEPENGCFYDHINHIVYDNRKSNLRLVTNQQNCCNQSLRVNNTSGYTGVSYNKDKNKWTAVLTYKYKDYYLGSFDDKNDAIAARKDAEIKYFGEYRFCEKQ